MRLRSFDPLSTPNPPILPGGKKRIVCLADRKGRSFIMRLDLGGDPPGAHVLPILDFAAGVPVPPTANVFREVNYPRRSRAPPAAHAAAEPTRAAPSSPAREGAAAAAAPSSPVRKRAAATAAPGSPLSAPTAPPVAPAPVPRVSETRQARASTSLRLMSRSLF